MSKDLSELKTGKTGKLIDIVASNPYITKDELKNKSNLEEKDFELALEKLLSKQVLIEMTRQSNSSMESRVPKTVFLLNPEIEIDL